MDFRIGDVETWPDWLHPDYVHKLLLQWFGPEWTFWIEAVGIGLAGFALFVHFVLVPLGIRRR